MTFPLTSQRKEKTLNSPQLPTKNKNPSKLTCICMYRPPLSSIMLAKMSFSSPRPVPPVFSRSPFSATYLKASPFLLISKVNLSNPMTSVNLSLSAWLFSGVLDYLLDGSTWKTHSPQGLNVWAPYMKTTPTPVFPTSVDYTALHSVAPVVTWGTMSHFSALACMSNKSPSSTLSQIYSLQFHHHHHRPIHNHCSPGLLQWLPNSSPAFIFATLPPLIHSPYSSLSVLPERKHISSFLTLNLLSGVSLHVSVGIMHLVAVNCSHAKLQPLLLTASHFPQWLSSLWSLNRPGFLSQQELKRRFHAYC